MALPLQRRNHATNPTFKATTGTVNVRTNNFANPSFETNTTGVVTNWGTTGAGTLSRPTTGGFTGTGPAHARMQWTTANTVIGGYTENTMGTLPVGTHVISTYVRVNRAAQRLQLNVSQSSGAFTMVSNPAVDVAINTWTRITATINVTTSGVMVARATAVTGGNGRVWAIGDQLDTDGWLADLTTTVLGAYFDGATAAAGDFTYAWAGTANASVSYERAPVVTGYQSYWAATDWATYQTVAQFHSDTTAMRSVAKAAQTFLLGTSSTNGTAVVAGDPLTASYYIRPSVTRTFRVSVGWDSAAPTLYGDFTSCPANVWTRVSVHGTVPAATTLATVYFNSETLSAAGDIYDIDSLLIEKVGAVSRTNLVPNPALTVDATGWTTYGGGPTNPNLTTSRAAAAWASSGWAWKVQGSGTSTPVMAEIGVLPSAVIAVGSAVTFSISLIASAARNARLRIRYAGGPGDALSPDITLNAATPVRASFTVTVPTGATSLAFNVVDGTTGDPFGASDWIAGSMALVEISPTLNAYFDGSTAAAGGFDYQWTGTEGNSTSVRVTAADTYFDGSTEDAGWSNLWTGTAHASASTRDATGLWVDVDLTGTAHTVLTVLGLGMSQSVTKIVRTDGKTSWPVPGWLRRLTIDADTERDWTVPLGRPVTYTLFKDGIAIATRTVTVAAATGDIMDPLDPPGALKVNTVDADPTVLTLSNKSITEVVHGNTASDREYPLGARYAISRPGVRASAQKVPLAFNAARNATSDALLDMVQDAPILLVRTLPSWGSVPPLIYTDAEVTETPFNRGRGGEFTQWSLEADAVAPVTRAVTAGKVTNAEVQANLAGRTHDSIKAASGTKRHVEIKANPLSLGQ